MHEQAQHSLYVGTKRWASVSSLDRFLVTSNCLVWFVNLGILLPRALT